MADADAVYVLGSLVPLKAYQAIIGLTLALAVASNVARNIITISTRRWHILDEGILAIAVACLVACTALAYTGAFTFYEYYAVVRQPDLLPANITSYDDLARNGMIWFSSFSVCAWTAIFCSKVHVLKGVWPALRQTPWLRWLFFAILGSSLVAWTLLCASAFVLQPFDYFEPDTYSGHSSDMLFIGVNSVATALDIATSLMVVLVLFYARMSRIRIPATHQTSIFGSCLVMILMAVFAILRVCRLYDTIHVDVVWMILWHYLEAGIALIVLPLLALGDKTAAVENDLGKPDEGNIMLKIRRKINQKNKLQMGAN